MLSAMKLYLLYLCFGHLIKSAECAVPCWSFATCGDVLPRIQISVAEHTAMGEIIFQASAVDPDGAGIWFYSLVQYQKPFLEWTFLAFTLDGELEVLDSTALDYETLTDGTPASAPHAILDIDAWDNDFETTYDQQDALVEITIIDIPEIPEFTSLPDWIALSESQKAEEEIFKANFTDPDIYLGETFTFTMTTNPNSGPFRIDTSNGKVYVTANPCFDFDALPVYDLNISLSDGTFDISEVLTVNIVDSPNVAPVINNLPNGTSISEAAQNGSSLFIARASDANPCDVIMYSLLTTGVPFTLDSSSGQLVLTGALDYETESSYDLSITASDGVLTSNPQIFSITVLDVAEYPLLTVNPENISIFENSTGSEIFCYLTFSDNTVSHVITTNPHGPFSLDVFNTTAAKLVLDSNPSLNFEEASLYDVTVTVSDGILSASVNVTIHVVDVNEAPSFTNLPNTTVVVEAWMYSGVLFTVQYMDPDWADLVTVNLISTKPFSDMFNCSSEGEISVMYGKTFDYESVSSYNLTIQLTDSSGLVAREVLTIQVDDINEKPVILGLPMDVYVSENSDGDMNVTMVTASDPEGDELHFNITDIQPVGAPVFISSAGLVGILPEPDFNYDIIDAYNITVEVSDGILTSICTITLHITDEDRPPRLLNVTNVSVFENETISRVFYQMDFIDSDIKDNWTFSIEETSPDTSVFICDLLNGTISFVDNPLFDYETIHTFYLNISVTDSTGLKDLQVLEVDVLDFDEIPLLIVTPNITTVNETDIGNITLFTINYLDPEDTTLTPLLLVNPPGPFILRGINGSVSEILIEKHPQLNFENISQYNITVSISDGQHNVSTKVTVLVLDDNEKPSFTNLPNMTTILENVLVPNSGHIFTVAHTDEDLNDNITVSLLNVVPNDTRFFCSKQGVVFFSPNTTFDYEVEKEYNLTIQLEDSYGLGVISHLVVYIVDVNEKPVLWNLPSYENISEDVSGSVNITKILAFDPEGQDLSYNITDKNPPDTPIKISSTGIVSMYDDAYFNYDLTHMYNVTIEVNDGLLSSSKYFILFITNEDRAPTFTNAIEDVFVMENESISRVIHNLKYNDKDIRENWTVTIETIEPSTSAFHLDKVAGNLSFVNNPGFDFETTDIFTLNVSVTDSTGLQDYQIINIHISNINEQPIINSLPINLSIDEDESGDRVLLNVTCEDPENDAITFIIHVNPDGPFVVSDLGEIIMVGNPGLDYENTSQYKVNVTCSDSQSLSDKGSFEVLIADINEAPVFHNFPNTINILENTTGGTMIFNLSASDEDNGDSFIYNITHISPPMGSVLWSVSAQTDFEIYPKYEVTVLVTDTKGLWDMSNITINIDDVNERPEILNLPDIISIYDGPSGDETIYNVNAMDPEDDLLLYSIDSSDPANAPFVINDAGHILLENSTVLDHFTVSLYTLNISVSDGLLQTTRILILEILNTPDAPVFVNLQQHLSLSELSLGNVTSFKFSDPDRDNVTIKMNVIGQIDNSPFHLSKAGVLTIKPPGLDFENMSNYLLNLTLTDDTGMTTCGTVNLTILDENEPPQCTTNSTNMDVQEELAKGTVLDTGITCDDVDFGDKISYNLTGEGVLYFGLVSEQSKQLITSNRVDRDAPSSVTHARLALVATDEGGLQDIVELSIHILDTNDNAPVFDVMTLNASFSDGTPNGTLISQVMASDLDDGLNGNISFEEFSSSEYLSIDKYGQIYLKLQLDHAETDVIEYQIQASDAGLPKLSTRATFILYVLEVIESVADFDKEFYNWEIYYDASIGMEAGRVHAPGIENIQYTFKVNHKEFSIDETSGGISVKSDLQDSQKYVLYISSYDAQVDGVFGSTIIRMDTYDPLTYLIDFEFDNDINQFTQLFLMKFKSLINQILPGSLPRVIFINGKQWSEYAYFNVSSSNRQLLQSTTTVTLLILKNNKSESFSNLDSVKEFYTVTTLLQYFTSHDDGSPNEYFNSGTFSEYQIKSITAHIEQGAEVEVKWWTESTEGLATLGSLSALAFILLILLLIGICIICKRKRDQKKRIFEPRKHGKTKISDDEKLHVEDLQDSSESNYRVMKLRSSFISWEDLPSKEIICTSPNLGDSDDGNIDGNTIFGQTPVMSPRRRNQTVTHSLSELFPDVSDRESPDVGYNSSRTVTPLSEVQSVSDIEVLSLKAMRASIVSPVIR